MNTPIPVTAANPFGFPAGPAVPYARILHATETTFQRLLLSLTGQSCTVDVRATATTAGVHWLRATGGALLTVSLVMPALPPHTLLSRSEATRMVGLLVHELMHVLHTDNDAWKPGTGGGPLLDSLINSLEDARIEALEIRLARIPGARDLFEALSEHYIREALTEGWTPGGPRTVPYTLAVLGRVCLGHVLPSAARIAVPAAVQPIVNAALARLPGCQSTADVVALAQDLLPQVETLAEPPPPPPVQERPQETQDGQGASEGTPGAPDAPDDAQDAQEAPAGAQQDAGDPPTAAYPEEPPTAAYPEDAPANPAPPSGAEYVPEAAMERLIEEIIKRANAATSSVAGNNLSGWRGPLVKSTGTGSARVTADDITRTRNFVLNAVKLKDTIRRHLRAPETVALEHRLTGGRLDRRALPRMASGARNVMVRRIDADGTNVGIVLLLDRSTSMDEGRRAIAARSLALHLGEACQHAGAECLIAAFTQTSQGALKAAGRSGLLLRLKDWHQRMNATAVQAILGLTNHGGTPLSEGIMGATDLLRARSHLSRRIVVALTDGEDNSGIAGVEWATGYAKAHGIEVIGLLLDGEDPAGLAPAALQMAERGFTNPVHACDPRQLTTLALAALARALRHG